MSDLRDRRAFCRVAELTSFAAAARDLGLPTATVSASVKRLEDTLGVRLLERTTRKVSVTEDGRAYYDQIAPLLDDITEVESRVHSRADTVSGRVRIAAPRHLASALLVPNIATLVRQHPGIELDFTLADAAVDMVGEAVDIAVRIGPLPDTSASAIRIGAFEQVLCAAPSWIETHGTIAHPGEIPDTLPMAYRFPGSARGYPWVFTKDDETIEINPHATIRFDDLDTYVEAGRAGLGPICVLSFQAASYLAGGDLIHMLTDWRGATIDVNALTPERRHRSRRVEVVLDWLRLCVAI
ncbi:LysR family transcriptional regulator [uncultured Roseobacter sp.]|uniref:LysR family transcriptional regulator n=1 Tax=uncultured Roseobacter sp. TaxID=114847 RepID=UPI00262E766B|nr:LysR family transcriptional regulator [uncultured Roseobacter sp.]